uniref:Uncharacterized protein n=1 Tax=Sipha flava TaxID=143950 RepID=A0A2S2QGC7_9HEMI
MFELKMYVRVHLVRSVSPLFFTRQNAKSPSLRFPIFPFFVANQPLFRVQPRKPFSHVSMDYGGPSTVSKYRRRNVRKNKNNKGVLSVVCMHVCKGRPFGGLQ